jgi:hypothetical protein
MTLGETWDLPMAHIGTDLLLWQRYLTRNTVKSSVFGGGGSYQTEGCTKIRAHSYVHVNIYIERERDTYHIIIVKYTSYVCLWLGLTMFFLVDTASFD